MGRHGAGFVSLQRSRLQRVCYPVTLSYTEARFAKFSRLFFSLLAGIVRRTAVLLQGARMRKWIVFGVIIIATIALVAAVLLNVNALVARNKDYLIAQAEQALGRNIRVGEVEATVLRGIGVRLRNFAMADDPRYGKEDFVRARDLQINLKLWPLFRKELQIKRLILHDPVIRVIRNARGEFNFESVGGPDEAKERGAKKTPSSGPRDRQGALLISLVDIKDGRLRYLDAKDGADLEVRQIDLTVEDFDFAKPFSVALAAAIYADKQNFTLTATAGPVARQDWTQTPVRGEVAMDGLDFGRLQTALPQVRKALPKDLAMSGTFTVKNLKFAGTFKKLAVDGAADATRAAVRYGDSFNKRFGVPLTAAVNGRYVGDKLVLDKSLLKLHTLEVASAGEIPLGEGAALNLALESKPASLEGWGEIVPALERYRLKGTMELRANVRGRAGKGNTPQLQGALTLRNASVQPPDFPRAIENLDTVIQFSGQRADVKAMTLSLGRSRLQVAAAIDRFAPLSMTYKLSTPELWPADYNATLAEDRKGDIIRGLKSEGRMTISGGNLAYQGNIASTEGTLYNVAYKALEASLSWADKTANVQNLRVNALSGAVQLQGDYSLKEAAPRFAFKTKLDGIDIRELYNALDAKAERDVRGRLHADLKLSGAGSSWEQIKPNLRGAGQAEIVQGAVLNFNIADSMLTGITGIPGLTQIISPSLRKKYPETFTAKDTEFKEVRSLLELADGRLFVKDLRMAAAEFVVVGNGSADFNRRLDFRGTLNFSQRLSTDLSASAREIKFMLNDQGQLAIPFSAAGTMPNVKFQPDTNFLGQMVQRGFLGRGAEDLQNRFLGGRERRGEREGTEEGGTKKRNSTEDLIRRGLENLFRR